MKTSYAPVIRRAWFVVLLLALMLWASDAVSASTVPAPPPSPFPAPNAQSGLAPRLVADGQLVYGHNMAGFDLEAHLRASAPHLLGLHQDLFAVSLNESINPRVLLTLTEMQSGIVSNKSATPAQLENPFGLPQKDAGSQLYQVASAMSNAFVSHYYGPSNEPVSKRAPLQVTTQDGKTVVVDGSVNAGSYAVLTGLALLTRSDALDKAIDPANPQGFRQTYERLFPGQNPLDESNVLPKAADLLKASSLPTLELPFPVGEAWKFNGVHYVSGTRTQMASIDFSKSFPAPGTDMRNDWVMPAAPGKVQLTGRSDNTGCQISVSHTPDGSTRTSYLHLVNPQVSHGQDISAANLTTTRLANPASNYADAITRCWPGTWSNPHVHFTLFVGGVPALLNGVQLSGWTVHSGTYSYDCRTSTMWLEKAGQKKYAWCSGTGGDTVPRGGGDPDDNRSLGSGQTLAGTISPMTDEDTYAFVGLAGLAATIRMSRSGGNLDSYLKLYGPDNRLLNDPGADDDRGGNGDALIDRLRLPQTGVYRVVASSWNGSSTGSYNISLTLAASGGTTSGNLARGKTAWATSSDSYFPASNGNDGNTGTRWSSRTSGDQWFTIDLGSAQTFNRFVVRWEAAYARTYWLAYSDDYRTWWGWQRTLSSRQDDSITFSPGAHRYVGVVMIDRAPWMSNFSFWEFEVYNGGGASKKDGEGTGKSDGSVEETPPVPVPLDIHPTP